MLFQENATLGNGKVVLRGSNDTHGGDIILNGQVDIVGDAKITGAVVMMENLPTSDPNVAGQLWNDGDTLKISNPS